MNHADQVQGQVTQEGHRHMSECLLQGHQGPRKTENVLHLLGVMGGAGAHICKHQAVVGMYPHLCHQLHSPPALPPPPRPQDTNLASPLPPQPPPIHTADDSHGALNMPVLGWVFA